MSTEEIRILHLIATGFVGGPEKQLLDHAVRAAHSRRNIWLGSFRDGSSRPEFLERAESLGLPTVELSSGRFDPRTILELALTIREKKFSLLCTHGYKANLLGWVASRLTGCPQIAFARGWTGENWRIKFYEQLDRLVLRWTDWVVCVSRLLTEQIEKTRRGRTRPLVIANCALLPFESLKLPVDRLALKEAVGLPQNSFCVCAVGRLSPEKGHRYLLEAVPTLVTDIPHLCIVLLGDGQERVNLEEHARRLGAQDRVIFVGFRKDAHRWIQACDLLVNPSLTEGMPNVVLEAMALGTPVVATSVGGVPDLVEHLTSGLLVPPGKPTTLADAVLYLFNNPPAAFLLAQNAHKRLAEYSPERQTRQLTELYARALQSSEGLVVPEPAMLPIEVEKSTL